MAALEYHLAHLPLQVALNGINVDIGGHLHLVTSSPESKEDILITIRVEDSKYLDLEGYVWSAQLLMGHEKVPLLYRRQGPRYYPVKAQKCDDKCLLAFHLSDQMHRISGNTEILRPWVHSGYAVGNSDTKRLFAMRKRQTELETARDRAMEETTRLRLSRDDAIVAGNNALVDELHSKLQEQIAMLNELNHKIEIGLVAMEQVSVGSRLVQLYNGL